MIDYITRKSLVNKSGVEWTDYSCNHYDHCAHNCKYCYARKLRKLDEEAWGKPSVIENALELAVKAIRKVPAAAKIMVSSMCDPYQPIERTEKLTRALIPVLAGFHEKTEVILITKSSLIQRDFELIKQFPNVKICMTITSVNDLPQFEPYAPGNTERIETLIRARANGIYTIASIEPWIPDVSKPMDIAQKIWPYVNEVFIGSYNYFYKPGSLADQRATRIYRTKLPYLTKFFTDRMIKVVVKKELTAKVIK